MKDKKDTDDYYLDSASPLVAQSALTVGTGTVECGGALRFRNLEGMGWVVTCLFIVGEMAGGGLIAMPASMTSAGLPGGVGIILFGAIICAYTGNKLSDCWTILQERWPEYHAHCRKPYPAIGLRAMGPRVASVVSCSLNVTQFGTAVVFLLLAAKNIESFLQSFGGVHIGFCSLVMCVAAFMLPFTLLKSPKDFWWLVIGAMITTSIAVSLILYGAYLDFPTCAPHVHYQATAASKVFMCFGTVMFAYGGHAAFPTIQHDMRKPYQFTRSVCLAFLIVFCMYLPVSIMGYLSYGDSLQHSIIPSLQQFGIQKAVNILITMHVILALTIVFNPLNQEWEELLDVPQDMGVHRVAARTFMMAAVVFVAETVPNFGVLLDLVGGSTITLMSLVLPVVFNLYLEAAKKKYGDGLAAKEEQPVTLSEVLEYTPRRTLALQGVILVLGVLGGFMATSSALQAMAGSEFSPPCYSSLFSSAAQGTPLNASHSDNGKFNCCGAFKNISRLGIEYCLEPGLYVASGSHG